MAFAKLNSMKFVGLDGLKHFWTKAKTWIAGQITAEVTAKIAEIVANAPEDLDTLKEIADWISSHANDAADMNTEIKENTEALNGKADKIHTHTKSDITDFPTSLKNPNALTVNGKTYDGSTAVDAGVQTVANGGTGVTTQAEINKAFISNLEVGNSDVTDGTEFVSSWASDNGFAETTEGAVNIPFKRQFIKVWNYIKGKISSVLGLTKDNYGGKASTAGTADKTVEVVDYGDTSRTVKIGYYGPSVTADKLLFLAGYTEREGNSVKLKDVNKEELIKWLGIPRIKYADYQTPTQTFTQFQQDPIELSNFSSEVTPNNVLCFMVIWWEGVKLIASADWGNDASSGLKCALIALQAGTGSATIRCVYMV